MIPQGGSGWKVPATGAVGGTVEVEAPNDVQVIAVNTGSSTHYYPVTDGKAVIPVPPTTPAGQPFVVFVPASKKREYFVVMVVDQ